MIADARMEALIRETLVGELGGARGRHPQWLGSPAHGRTDGRRGRPAAPPHWTAAVVAVLLLLAVGVVIRPVTLPAIGPGTSGIPVELDTRLLVAGQAFDPVTGRTGSAVLVESRPDGERRVWLLSPEGEVRPGPRGRSVPSLVGGSDPSHVQVWGPTDRHWVSDGRTIARVIDLVRTTRDDGSVQIRPTDQVEIAMLNEASPWTTVVVGTDLVDAAERHVSEGGISAIPGSGRYLLTGTSRILSIDDDGWTEGGALPRGHVVVGPTNEPDWFVIARADGIADPEPPFHASLWSPEGRTIDIGTDVLGIAPTTHEVGLTWVLREGRGWQALRVAGYQPGWEAESQGAAGGDASVAIDPTGSVVLKAPRDGASGQTSLIDRSTGAVLQVVDGAPTGRVAWFGDAAVFMVDIPGEDGEPADGGLVRLSPTGAEHVTWGRPVSAPSSSWLDLETGDGTRPY